MLENLLVCGPQDYVRSFVEIRHKRQINFRNIVDWARERLYIYRERKLSLTINNESAKQVIKRS